MAVSDLAQLPEPPTSEDSSGRVSKLCQEIGFRALPEALMSGKAVGQKVYVGCFEDASLWYRQTYEIHKVECPGYVPGRQIIALEGSSGLL